MSSFGFSRSVPDVRRDIAAWIAHLMGTCWSIGFIFEGDVEVLIECHASLFAITVDLHQIGSVLLDGRIELIVPRRVQRIGHVQTFTGARES